MPPNEIFGCADILIVEMRQMLRPANQRLAKVPPEKEPTIVTQNRGSHPDEDDPLDPQCTTLVSQKTRENQDGFTREWQAGTLRKQCDQDSPVAPGTEHVADRVVHPVHGVCLDAETGWTSGFRTRMRGSWRNREARRRTRRPETGCRSNSGADANSEPARFQLGKFSCVSPAVALPGQASSHCSQA